MNYLKINSVIDGSGGFRSIYDSIIVILEACEILNVVPVMDFNNIKYNCEHYTEECCIEIINHFDFRRYVVDIKNINFNRIIDVNGSNFIKVIKQNINKNNVLFNWPRRITHFLDEKFENIKIY